MITEIKHTGQEGMTKNLVSFRHNLAKIRTGRASPNILAHITIDYHSTQIPISQIASIVILDARTLSITPWEKGISAKIEKAILSADLGLNPINSGNNLLVQIPNLSAERRKTMVKQVRLEAEKTRVSIRGIRRNINIKIKESIKQKEISEDQAKRHETEVQTLTNRMIAKIDVITKEKEQDLMAI